MLASMLSPTDSTCYGGGGTDGVSDGEGGLDLLRDEDGNSDESSGYQVDNGIGYVVDEQLTSKQFGYGVTQQSHSDPHLMSHHQNPVGSRTNSRKRCRTRYGYGAVIIKGFIPPSKTHKVKGNPVVLDPYKMVNSEMKLDFKKCETILSENAISLSGNKDHPNACLVYMLYCLTIQKLFNLAYYTAMRIASVIKSNFMVLPYGMLLTRLYKHVHTTHLFSISDIHYLVNHVMIPLTEGKTRRIMIDGKRPHPQTPSESSSSSPSPTPNQEEINPVNNFTLDPIAYIDQLLPILRREAPEFKQTKGMFKLFGHFLSNLGKKNKGRFLCANGTGHADSTVGLLPFELPAASGKPVPFHQDGRFHSTKELDGTDCTSIQNPFGFLDYLIKGELSSRRA
nr:hypothetical protein [Tanacetum cinerariifolium]